MFTHVTIYDTDLGVKTLRESYYSASMPGALSFINSKLNEIGIRDGNQLFKLNEKLQKDGKVKAKHLMIQMEKTDYNPTWTINRGGKKHSTKQTAGACGCKMQNGKKCPYAGKYGGKCKRHA